REASFDRVFSSFMFHHLPADEKESTLREVQRVLKTGGEFSTMDFEGPHGVHGLLARLLHARKTLADNAEDRVLSLMRQTGFTDKRLDAGPCSLAASPITALLRLRVTNKRGVILSLGFGKTGWGS